MLTIFLSISLESRVQNAIKTFESNINFPQWDKAKENDETETKKETTIEERKKKEWSASPKADWYDTDVWEDVYWSRRFQYKCNYGDCCRKHYHSVYNTDDVEHLLDANNNAQHTLNIDITNKHRYRNTFSIHFFFLVKCLLQPHIIIIQQQLKSSEQHKCLQRKSSA